MCALQIFLFGTTTREGCMSWFASPPPFYRVPHSPPFFIPRQKGDNQFQTQQQTYQSTQPKTLPVFFVPLVMVKSRWQNRSNPSIGPPSPSPATPPSPNSPILGSAVFQVVAWYPTAQQAQTAWHNTSCALDQRSHPVIKQPSLCAWLGRKPCYNLVLSVFCQYEVFSFSRKI